MRTMKRLPLSLSILLLSACSGGGGNGGSNADSAIIPATDVTLKKPDKTPNHNNNAGNSENTPDAATPTAPTHEQPKPVDTAAKDSPSATQPLPGSVVSFSPGYETVNVTGDAGTSSAIIPATDITLNKPDKTSNHNNNAGNSENTPDAVTPAESPREQPKPVDTAVKDSPSVTQPLPEPVVPFSPRYQAVNVTGDDGYISHASATSVNYDSDLKEAQTNFNTVLIKIKGTDIEVFARAPEEVPGKKEISLLDSTVNKFVDTNGQLVGYYGKAVTIDTENHRSGYAGDEKYRIDNMFYAMDKNQARLPEINANYQGAFYYYYESITREAAVALTYNDKKITGNITGKGNNHHWEIKRQNNSVRDDGTFFVRLDSKSSDSSIKKGVLEGGFYGKQGEFVAGKAYNDQDDPQWAGVLGATRSEK